MTENQQAKWRQVQYASRFALLFILHAVLAANSAFAKDPLSQDAWQTSSERDHDRGHVQILDTDGDGIPNQWELDHGLDPNNPADAWLDPDQDGFSNLTEYLLGTDLQDEQSHPTLADNSHKILAYWPLMTNAAESLENTLDGELKNGASFHNNSLKLDGKDDYVNFGNSQALSITSSIAYCLWLKPEDVQTMSRILGKFKNQDKNREYAAFLCADRLWVFFSDDGTPRRGHTLVQASKPRILTEEKWFHLAVSWDATNSSSGLSCWLDGKQIAMQSILSSDITSLHTGAADLTLGTYDVFSVGQGKKSKEVVRNTFKGSIAQLLLCDAALPELEIRELCLLGREGAILEYLEMDFDLDGIPDWWERLYFGDVSQTADADFDQDGLSNILELQAGTNPTAADSDNDGLTDGQEVLTWQTNPLDPDTDHDGWSDGQEVANGSDPKNALSFPASVAGTVNYAGWQKGSLLVIAAETAGGWVSDHSAIIATTGAYSIANLPTLVNYWLKAYRDSNNNGIKDSWEASGVFPGNPVNSINNLAGIDIVLSDPDTDSDGMPDWWERTYLGGLSANPGDDPDGDGVNNLAEYQARTDPKNADTDRDGFNDVFDNMVSRAFIEWGHPDFTIGDEYRYTAPSWLKKACRIGGEWIVPPPPGTVTPLFSAGARSSMLMSTFVAPPTPDMDWGDERIYLGEDSILREYLEDDQWYSQQITAPLTWKQADALLYESPMLLPWVTDLVDPEKEVEPFNPSEWHVPATEPDGVGSLQVELDRNIISNNLVMRIELFDHAGSTLYVDLLDTNSAVVASDLYGNILTGSNVVAWKQFDVPLVTYPSAAIIRIRRGTGEITVSQMLLYIDQDHDQLDAGQEAMLGTSDLSVDSDGDGTGDKVEYDSGTNPTNPASFLAAISGTITYSGPETGAVHVVVSLTNSPHSVFKSQLSSFILPSAFSVTNLPTLTNYWVFAYRDWNGNSSNELWEPAGSYVANPLNLTDNSSGIDITLSDSLDSDSDGLPDCWEAFYFGNSTSAVATADQEPDGLNNLQEYRQSCDPFNPDSNKDGIYDGGGWMNIRHTEMKVLPSGQVMLAMSYPNGFTNKLDIFACTNLLTQEWVLACTTNVSGSTNSVSWVDADSANHRIRFYQTWNADFDGDSDGLSDGREKRIYKTNPSIADSDGDGLTDGQEVLTYHSNPLSTDTDGDGLSDSEEASRGTNPSSADSDGDGLTDFQEIYTYYGHVDPLDPDYDLDGLNDYQELVTYGTYPRENDSDGDGLDDKDEIDLGTNPMKADSDGDGIDDEYEVYYEWNPLDNANASQDDDKDGFSNLTEYEWCMSPTSSNTVPYQQYQRLITRGPGQNAIRTIDTINYVLITGDLGDKSAIVRVRPCQTNGVIVPQRLYHSQTPGIFINGTDASSMPSPIEIPAQGAAVDYRITVAGTPHGTNIFFALTDANNVTGLSCTARFYVPKLDRVEVSSGGKYVYVNYMQTNTFWLGMPDDTNACVVRMHPYQTPAQGYGIPYFDWTDWVRFKVTGDGAVIGTNTLNYLDYRSAYGPWNSDPTSQGVKLTKPGTYTFEIGFDFNKNGIVDAGEVQETCVVNVIKLGMTAYRPITEGTNYGNPFQRQAIPENTEETPGAGIRVNGDDDNTSGISDRNETTVNNENDLIEIVLNVDPPVLPGFKYVLKRSRSNLKVWTSRTKETILLDTAETNLTFASTQMIVWAECITNAGTVDLELQARNDSNTVVCTDKVHLYPFTSITIVFGGETQNPIDPVPAGNLGVFRIATNLYANGFDAYMYSEPDGSSPNTEDFAFNGITNAFRNRSVTRIAIIGYSHGGGSTWALANRLVNDGTATNIVFTAYIDAVAQPLVNTTEENRRPPSSQYHVNYYQENGLFELGGGPINPPGANYECDVNTNTWGTALQHGTIDDSPEVLSGVLTRFMSRVTR